MPIQPTPSPFKLRLAVVLGTIIEWYDFALYGYLALYIAATYFPETDTASGLIQTFGIFALGFIARPIGSLVFGHASDVYGRKRVLAFAIILTSLATVGMGLIPSYASIGLLAPILLMVCRLIQGFAVGAEFNGGAVFLTEHAEKNQTAYAGSWIGFSCAGGILLGALAGYVVFKAHALWPDYTELWRIPFLLALVGGVVGLKLRLNLPESPQFVAQHKRLRRPIMEVLHAHKRACAVIMGIACINGVLSYILFVYLGVHLIRTTPLSPTHSQAIIIFSIGLVMLTQPLLGRLADNIGHIPQMFYSALALLLLSYPLTLMLQQHTWMIIFAAFSLGLLLSSFTAPMNAVLTTLLPAHCRCSGIFVFYNISMMMFGGTTPLMTTWLGESLQTSMAIAYVLVPASLIGMLATYYANRSPYRHQNYALEPHLVSSKLRSANHQRY